LFIAADKHNSMFEGSYKQFIYLDKLMLRFIGNYLQVCHVESLCSLEMSVNFDGSEHRWKERAIKYWTVYINFRKYGVCVYVCM